MNEYIQGSRSAPIPDLYRRELRIPKAVVRLYAYRLAQQVGIERLLNECPKVNHFVGHRRSSVFHGGLRNQTHADNAGTSPARTYTTPRHTIATDKKTTPKVTNHDGLAVRADLATRGWFNEGTNSGYER